MNQGLQQSMFAYYDERAAEYDGIYSDGRIPNSSWDPQLFRTESRRLGEVVGEHCGGRILDIPCGTGYWMQFYREGCREVTLVDQSRRMLLRARSRAQALGVEDRVHLVQADVLNLCLPDSRYDCALAGFILSHLEDSQIAHFLTLLRRSLKHTGSLLMLESAWSDRRRRRRAKEGRVTRMLEDGRTFDIYKRFFDRDDLDRLAERHRFTLEVLFEGDVYMACLFRHEDS